MTYLELAEHMEQGHVVYYVDRSNIVVQELSEGKFPYSPFAVQLTSGALRYITNAYNWDDDKFFV